MNLTSKQEKIIEELKVQQKVLGHSPRRREVPYLAKRCYAHFNSFNRAKQLAGLEIKNTRKINFPKKAFEIDKTLSFIVAYLVSDGHLYKDLKGFYFSSKDLKKLKELEKKIKKKFYLGGSYRKGLGYGVSYKLLFFNKKLSIFLNNLGVPAGDKMLSPFDVPLFIKENNFLAKEYLKTIFYCEGSKYKQSKNTETIRLNFNKSEKFLQGGLIFMDSLKGLLKKFEINTTETWISKGKRRKKDKHFIRTLSFEIKSQDVNKFINKIGWVK